MPSSTEVRRSTNAVQLVRALRFQRERFAPDIRWADGGEDWRTFCTIANTAIEQFLPEVGTAIRSHVFDYGWGVTGVPLTLAQVEGRIAVTFREHGTLYR